ncbi:glycosyltransferase family 4 protein [Synechocystis salina]|uniref:glycosyltransferase family 4 protein n=1 Tax=Synechocystis salina TaxID=945780 RepID=UPI001D143A22|nr:glycosyltransferase family 4 protein [Synechocystis salina]
MSDSKWDDEPRQWWKEKIKSLLYVNKFHGALVAGNAHKDYLVRLGMNKQSIFLGYDVVDNDYFTQQTEKARQHPVHTQSGENFPPLAPYFIAVSRFIPRKNLLLLLDAYLKYYQKSQAQAWELVICGSGIQENIIRQFIQAHSLDSVVHLPGFISYQKIPHWYAGAKTFIHPALQEQWGLVVNEAMAAGLPVLVSNRCGCYPDLVQEGINGFGFDPENTAQLTSLMLRISSGQVDLIAMGQASLTHIQKYSPDHFAQGLQQAIECALSHRNNQKWF